MPSIWDVKIVHDSLDHPECLAFGPSGALYAGGEAGQVYRIDIGTKKTDVIANLGGFICGVTLDGDENVYACATKARNVTRVLRDGTTSIYCDKVDGSPLVNPNFSVFHTNGDMYLTDSGDYQRATGRLIRVHPDGTSESLLGNHLNFPNGLALSADENMLYMIESTSSKISKMTIEQGGTLSPPETVVQLQGSVPDGMAFDTLGNLYVGCYTPDIIFKVDRRREVTVLLEDRTSELLNRPTNVAFRPMEGSTDLYFANLGWWHIAKVDVGAVGQRLNYPHLPR